MLVSGVALNFSLASENSVSLARIVFKSILCKSVRRFVPPPENK